MTTGPLSQEGSTQDLVFSLEASLTSSALRDFTEALDQTPGAIKIQILRQVRFSLEASESGAPGLSLPPQCREAPAASQETR